MLLTAGMVVLGIAIAPESRGGFPAFIPLHLGWKEKRARCAPGRGKPASEPSMMIFQMFKKCKAQHSRSPKTQGRGGQIVTCIVQIDSSYAGHWAEEPLPKLEITV